MRSLVVMVLLGVVVQPSHGVLMYGRCPDFKVVYSYESFRIRPFEGEKGAIQYFSNVRFDALHDKRLEIKHHWSSHYTIVLERKDECYQPFQLQLRGAQIFPSNRSAGSGSITTINVAILELHDDFMFAFSCAQLGHNKLEYVWIFGRAGRSRIGKEKVQQLFGHLLADTSTKLKDLRRTHHDVPFCKTVPWMMVYCAIGGVLLLVTTVSGIVCWKKHQQILQLRRQSCAEYEPSTIEELEVDEQHTREITSAKTIAILHGTVM